MNPSFKSHIASLCASTAIFAAFAGNAHAAPIAWGTASTVAGDSDVSTTGTLQYAVHWGGTDATVNGVSFTAPGPSTVTTSASPGVNSNIGAYVGLSAAYRDILKGNWYNAKNQTTTLNTLTVGQTYQVQIWAADIRYTTGQFTDIGSGPSLLISNSSSNNVNVADYGQYAIGVFTADATTQVISFPNTGNGVVNAFMVRDITGSGSGAADAATSSVSSSSALVSADGSSSATITVTLRDAALNPVSGKAVSLSSSRGPADTISVPSGLSNGSGVVTFTVTSTTVGSSVFSATDVTDGNLAITQTAGVTFFGPVDASSSTVVASAESGVSDGITPVTITVTLKDASLNPVSGKTVSLSSSRGATDAISTASGPSSAAGVVTFTVTSSTTGSAVFSATDVTDGNLAINQSATVDFTSLVIGGQQFNTGDVPPAPIVALSGDLLESNVATATGEKTTANLRNGTTGTAGEATTTNPSVVFTNPSVTYDLDLAASPQGYNIQEIRLFSGWTDARAGQSYSISYSLAGDPATFTLFGTVSALRTNGSLLTRTYDLTGANLLTGVAAIRFTMINNGNAGTGTVFREFDVIGTTMGGTSADYTAWKNFYSLSGGPDDDDDGDGVLNREEYAFGLIPNSGSSSNPITAQLDKGTGKFTYSRRDKALSNLNYSVWTSTDLQSWSEDTGAQENAASPVANVESVEITISPSLLSAPKLFVQVRASN